MRSLKDFIKELKAEVFTYKELEKERVVEGAFDDSDAETSQEEQPNEVNDL